MYQCSVAEAGSMMFDCALRRTCNREEETFLKPKMKYIADYIKLNYSVFARNNMITNINPLRNITIQMKIQRCCHQHKQITVVKSKLKVDEKAEKRFYFRLQTRGSCEVLQHFWALLRVDSLQLHITISSRKLTSSAFIYKKGIIINICMNPSPLVRWWVWAVVDY